MKRRKRTCVSLGSHSCRELLKWLAHWELLINKGHSRCIEDRQRRRRQWQGAPEYEIGNKIKISCQSFIVLFQMFVLISQWKFVLWEMQMYDACYRLTVIVQKLIVHQSYGSSCPIKHQTNTEMLRNGKCSSVC